MEWRSVNLDQGSPEDVAGVLAGLVEEEVGSRCDEFLLGQLAILVGVDGGEGGVGAILEAEDVEEDGVFLLGDEAVVVGINDLEEEWEGCLQGALHAGVVDQLLEGADEGLLGDGVAAAYGGQVLVPDGEQVSGESLGLVGVQFLAEALGHTLE